MKLAALFVLVTLSSSLSAAEVKQFSAAQCKEMRTELMHSMKPLMPVGATADQPNDTDPNTVVMIVLKDENAGSHVSDDGQMIYFTKSVLTDPKRVEERQSFMKQSLERRLERKYGGSCAEHPL